MNKLRPSTRVWRGLGLSLFVLLAVLGALLTNQTLNIGAIVFFILLAFGIGYATYSEADDDPGRKYTDDEVDF